MLLQTPTVLTRVLFLLLLPALPVCAQRERDTYTSGPTIEISGQVKNDLGEPAADVAVRLERFSGGLVEQISTDKGGRFRFSGLTRGHYQVAIVAAGYVVAPQAVDMQVIFKQYLVFDLKRDNSLSLDPRGLAVIDARVPENARNEYARARTAFLSKKTKDAVSHLGKAILVYPNFFEAHLMLGAAHIADRNWQGAEAALLKAEELKPENANVLLMLGEVYWRQGRHDEAEKVLLDGLKFDANSWKGHFTLACVYWDRKEVLKAAQPVARALQLNPNFAEAHMLAGNVLLRLGEKQRALVEYEEYLKLAPKGEFATQIRDLLQKLRTSPPQKTSKPS